MARDLDATVFWNYIDLRFTAPRDLLLEVRLSEDRLVVHLREQQAAPAAPRHPLAMPAVRLASSADAAPHDCVDCSNTACVHFIAERAAPGRTLWLLDDHWPEFDAWRSTRPVSYTHLTLPTILRV